MLEARTGPAKLFDEKTTPPDLFSRLAAIPHLTIDRPGWEGMVPILLADLAVHGHLLSEKEIREAAFALPRHLGAPRLFCRALDQAPPGLGRRATLKWALEQAHVTSG